MDKKKISVVIASLVGCGAVIGTLSTVIYYNLNKPYLSEVKRLKKEASFGYSKEFLRELKKELKNIED